MVGSGAVPAGQPLGAAVHEELLHKSERSLVTRVSRSDGSIVRKEPLGANADRRLRHEREILHRLAGVEGVVQLAVGVAPDQTSVALTDLGGKSLAQHGVPVDPDELARLAERLARAVSGMHRRGVVHRDISPGNIMLPEGGGPCLIDFALASTFAEIRPEFTHHSHIVGTLAYLAPEQTGRTGRPVDQRADLYALGATLYELATGQPPFGTGDPLRLSHDHLARVATAPSVVNPAVPAPLSAIIMHLLEKEPDNRYQTADGLVHDLVRLQAGVSGLRVGEHDYPARLLAPSRLVGRDTEITALGAAFADAIAGGCRGVLVSGAPGVGKSALVDELRPIVTAHDGWFVAGKFDQFRRDQEFDAVRQAFRSLGRLLLAEPEEELVELRHRLLGSLGANAGLLTAVVPEFEVLLRVRPDPGDSLTAQARARRVSVEILRAVASRHRPLVFFVDDLQWAGRTPLGLMDAVLGGEEDIEGLLLVGAYREGEVDVTHPLAAMLSRWQRQDDRPMHLRLANLPPEYLAAMMADMLRLDPDRAAELSREIVTPTGGNPFDTVELLNSLRHEGILQATQDGWRWSSAALRRRLPRTDVADLLAARIEGLPAATRAVLEAMACLGGRAEVGLVRIATGLSYQDAERRLGPALDDGLLVLELGPDSRDVVRFRHDRVREAMLGRLATEAEHALRLGLARRLAQRPELFAVAAQQYLPVVDEVHDPVERRRMRDLFCHAADEAKVLSNFPTVERLLARAAELTDPDDTSTLIDVYTGRHAALYSLGRLDEADETYRVIDDLCTDAVQRNDATVVQISNLTNQGRPREAVDLGVKQLRRLGMAVPGPDTIEAEIDRGLDELYRWVDEDDEAGDLRRPEYDDQAVTATVALINRMFPPTFFCDQRMTVWMTLETLAMWRRHGPSRTLVGSVSHVGYITIGERSDYLTGYRAIRRVLAVSEARGYEPETSHGRFEYVLASSHWFEPIEETVQHAQVARDGLIQGGDLQNACWNFYPLLYGLLDSGSSLDDFAAEVDRALRFGGRTGNEQCSESLRSYRRLTNVLRAEPIASAPHASLAGHQAGSNIAAANLHITRALAAVLLDNGAELAQHAAAAMPMLPFIEGQYPTAVAHLLRAMALAGEVRGSMPGSADAVLVELDKAIDWLRERAADAPMNFLHLFHLSAAERAWALGDFPSAARAFDEAQRTVAGRQRPWHRALILERSARFYLAHGMEFAGYALLAWARREYIAWGATAKVNQLDWAYPKLHEPPDVVAGPPQPSSEESATRRSSVMTGTIDLLGILAAAQALSSETSIEGLRARVVTLLSEMTGATSVQLLLRDNDGWLLSSPDAHSATITLKDAGRRRLLAPSVVRYAERTREPLVVADLARDDRFARDPYLADLDHCSLLAVPIFNRGVLQAMLLLENRLIRGAFSAERLDAVNLIAGQLAVSLDNALIYTSLESKVTERTQQLALANQRLERLSITDPLTGLANRRRLQEVLSAEWNRARHLGTPIGLAMIDVDHFKLYNDHFGHLTGDRCLQRVAAQLSQQARDGDLVARYGGEEFAIVMPEADLDTTLRMCERVRSAVIAVREPHPLTADGIVTVTIGAAAEIPMHGRVDQLIETADAELYHAKRAGRNQVSAARSPATGRAE